jgi:hypothetical protein
MNKHLYLVIHEYTHWPRYTWMNTLTSLYMNIHLDLVIHEETPWPRCTWINTLTSLYMNIPLDLFIHKNTPWPRYTWINTLTRYKWIWCQLNTLPYLTYRVVWGSTRSVVPAVKYVSPACNHGTVFVTLASWLPGIPKICLAWLNIFKKRWIWNKCVFIFITQIKY